jgi:hypothetical protein
VRVQVVGECSSPTPIYSSAGRIRWLLIRPAR